MTRAIRAAKQRKARFLSLFRSIGIVAEAAKRTPVDRMDIYHRWLKDEGFRKEFESIREAWLDRLEGELYKLGTGAYAEPIASGGRIVGERRIRDRESLIALLRAYRPLFRERVAMEMSGGVKHVGVNVKVKKEITVQMVADATRYLMEAGVSVGGPHPENEHELSPIEDLKARHAMKLLEQPPAAEKP
jgi:hypothetical protein